MVLKIPYSIVLEIQPNHKNGPRTYTMYLIDSVLINANILLSNIIAIFIEKLSALCNLEICTK